jgi:hypothetical protein
MREIEVSRVLPGSVETVFQACGDFTTVAERISSITKLEIIGGGPVRDGTRFKETRLMFGREHEEEMEIRDWAPPKGYTVVCDSHGTHYRTLHVFEAVSGEETRVTLRFGAEPRTLMAKIMSVFMGGKMFKMVGDCIGKDLGDIASWLEQQGGPTQAATATEPT